MTQNNTKIQGKFYPLTPELAKKLREAKLTAAEWRFWAYLVEIDPYGDRYHDLNPLTIQAECEMSKPTYYRAKAKFQELEIFDFQEEKVSFRNLTGVSKMRLESRKFNSESQKRDSESQKRDSNSQKRENRRSKPSPDKASSTPKTLQTYSDFIKTLSEGERESFLNFANKKASELPKPPTLSSKWIEVHFEELRLHWQQQNSTNDPKISGTMSSANVPKFESWDASTHEGQYHTLMNLGLVKFCLNATSSAWYEWARAKHPERFIEVPD
ncbi:hypothetical protein [Tolypothrix sp. NIES-4075]|uniref:hypothetical protein n=1 Tax=Tolypothrix sp. NIES-4075 TaxID=2005459 RepID=UPI00117F5E8A|nr:hypothetical protein [Tolypothrix sp. NIES-4075]